MLPGSIGGFLTDHQYITYGYIGKGNIFAALELASWTVTAPHPRRLLTSAESG
jgi:hypothetical protein